MKGCLSQPCPGGALTATPTPTSGQLLLLHADLLTPISTIMNDVFPMPPLQVRTSSVATGVGNVLGNKGGVAVTFNLAGAQVGVHGAVRGFHVLDHVTTVFIAGLICDVARKGRSAD